MGVRLHDASLEAAVAEGCIQSQVVKQRKEISKHAKPSRGANTCGVYAILNNSQPHPTNALPSSAVRQMIG